MGAIEPDTICKGVADDLRRRLRRKAHLAADLVAGWVVIGAGAVALAAWYGATLCAVERDAARREGARVAKTPHGD